MLLKGMAGRWSSALDELYEACAFRAVYLIRSNKLGSSEDSTIWVVGEKEGSRRVQVAQAVIWKINKREPAGLMITDKAGRARPICQALILTKLRQIITCQAYHMSPITCQLSSQRRNLNPNTEKCMTSLKFISYCPPDYGIVSQMG